MVGCGFLMLALFITAIVLSSQQKIHKRWFLWAALLSLPLPWIAAELGWVVAEVGRQPWVIEGILPTFLGVSSVTSQALWTSLGGFALLYTLLAIVELFLMVKYIRLGPPTLSSNPKGID